MSLVAQPSVVQPSGGSRTSGNLLYNVLELILDRGLVIDVFVRVSLVGIEVLTIDARVVVASVDTYLRFAEACNRLDLNASGNPLRARVGRRGRRRDCRGQGQRCARGCRRHDRRHDR